MQLTRSGMIYVKQSTVLLAWIALALTSLLSIPISASAGNSTAGLVYLFLPFIYAFAFFLIGTAVSVIYLITCIFRAKQNRFMDIEQTNIFKRKLFWIWKVAVLIWIAVIVLGFITMGASLDGLFFAAIYVVVPSALVGIPLYVFVAIKGQYSR